MAKKGTLAKIQELQPELSDDNGADYDWAGCDRNDVVGICGVAHPLEKSHREDGKKADHVLIGIT